METDTAGVARKPPASRPQFLDRGLGARDELDQAAPAGPRLAAPLSGLLVLLTLVVLAPVLALKAHDLRVQVRGQRAAEIGRLSELAADLARSVDRELTGQIDTAEMLSGSRSLQRRDLPGFRDHAEDAAILAKGRFVLVERSLRPVGDTQAPIGAGPSATADREAVEEVFAAGAPRVGDLHAYGPEGRPAFAVHVPVRIDGEPRYALSHYPRDDLMRELVEGAYRPDGWFASVFDSKGRIVARSYRHEEFLGREVRPDVLSRIEGEAGLLETTDLEGRLSLTAHHASSVSNWTVLVWAPVPLLEEPAAQAQRRLLSLAAMAVVVSLAAAHAAGRLIRVPLARLLQAACDLGRGERVIFAPSAMREANVVGAALKEAAETIRLREAALRENEAHMKLVMREMSHRTKNLLTVIQGIASKSARLSPNFEEFRHGFQSRLMAISTSQDLLVERKWESVPLDELVRSQLNAFVHPQDERLTVDGPALSVGPQAAQNLGMALHELATNALKYGALSSLDGRVSVSWERFTDAEGEPGVRLRWEESGGPTVSRRRRGFGSVMIEEVVAQSLRGVARLDWRPQGVVWELDAPVSFLT